MWIRRLLLANFRSYRRLALELEPGIALFCGQNGQGKSNLLEAVHVLATTRSLRTSSDRELITWRSLDDPASEVGAPPFARLEGWARGLEKDVHVELLFKGELDPSSSAPAAPGPAVSAPGEVAGPLTRSIRVNGLPTRAAGLIGQLPVVAFSPLDVAIADGAPSVRRQYLNIACSQVDPLYLRALQRFNRVLAQRNQVLRQIRERRQPLSALHAWTDQLVRAGSFVLRQRLGMVQAINGRIAALNQVVAGTDKVLQLAYRSAVELPAPAGELPSGEALTASFRAALDRLAAREVEQAVSLVGPHRDDFSFLLDGMDLHAYGSRGQQRLGVLALKLAETDWMTAELGDRPVLLLDDILSELDPERRRFVLAHLTEPSADEDGTDHEAGQIWITVTDLRDVSEDLRSSAQHFNVDAGTVRPA